MEIINERSKKPFESLNEIRERIPSIPNPIKAIEKRMLDELTLDERHRLFVR